MLRDDVMQAWRFEYCSERRLSLVAPQTEYGLMSLVQATCFAFPTGHRLHELLPGPPANRLLADFGADVIEIRPP